MQKTKPYALRVLRRLSQKSRSSFFLTAAPLSALAACSITPFPALRDRLCLSSLCSKPPRIQPQPVFGSPAGRPRLQACHAFCKSPVPAVVKSRELASFVPHSLVAPGLQPLRYRTQACLFRSSPLHLTHRHSAFRKHEVPQFRVFSQVHIDSSYISLQQLLYCCAEPSLLPMRLHFLADRSFR